MQSRGRTKARPIAFVTGAETFFKQQELGEELFGPSMADVNHSSREEMLKFARGFGDGPCAAL